jgi:magnesium-protoporphyrin O-methyltransferase
VAGDWDEVARRRAEAASRSSPEDRARELEMLRLADDVGGRRVLDLGCGTGALARRLTERGARVLALDPSPEAIDTAHEDAREVEPRESLEFGVADPDDRATLPAGPFDLVVLTEHAPGAALRNAVHALRRGGRLLLAVYPDEGPQPLRALFGRLRREGLRVIDASEGGPWLVLLAERPRRARRRTRR